MRSSVKAIKPRRITVESDRSRRLGHDAADADRADQVRPEVIPLALLVLGDADLIRDADAASEVGERSHPRRIHPRDVRHDVVADPLRLVPLLLVRRALSALVVVPDVAVGSLQVVASSERAIPPPPPSDALRRSVGVSPHLPVPQVGHRHPRRSEVEELEALLERLDLDGRHERLDGRQRPCVRHLGDDLDAGDVVAPDVHLETVVCELRVAVLGVDVVGVRPVVQHAPGHEAGVAAEVGLVDFVPSLGIDVGVVLVQQRVDDEPLDLYALRRRRQLLGDGHQAVRAAVIGHVRAVRDGVDACGLRRCVRIA